MKYLIVFVHDSHWLDFKYAELNALLAMHSIDPATVYSSTNCNKSDIFLEIELENDDVARSVSARSICIRAIYELMSGGGNYKFSYVKEDISANYSRFLQQYIENQQSWSMQIESVFGVLTMEDKNYYRQLFPFLQVLGPVDVKNPSYILTLLLDLSSKPDDLRDHSAIPAFFGRLICREQMRATVSKFDLKKRLYLGPTSLDHSLAFIMGNLAMVQKGDLVLDPFVGTASILVALAHFGCRCFGTDIDPRVLRGQMFAGKGVRAPNEKNIFQNFKAYGLEPPELLRLDNHISDRHYHIQPTHIGLFDVIVTDPPYGIRAGARKSGKKGGVSYSIDAEKRWDHVPTTQSYPVEEVMLDLLHMSSRMLVIGGRLIYLIPTTYDFELSDLPRHPCLEILQVCEQPLSSRHGRRAVVMKKIREYDLELEAEFAAYKQEVMSGRDLGFGQLIHKLSRALAVNAYYDEDVVKRASNACARRKEGLRRKKAQKAVSADTSAESDDDATEDGQEEDATSTIIHYQEKPNVANNLDDDASREEKHGGKDLLSTPISSVTLTSTEPINSTQHNSENSVENSTVNLPPSTLTERSATEVNKKNNAHHSSPSLTAARPVATSSKGLSPRKRIDGGWYHNSLLVGIGAGFALVAVYSLLSAHFKRPR